MKIGFTGTQKGMTEHQRDHVKLMLGCYNMESGYNLELHHGGCIGADYQVHLMWQNRLGIDIVVHPASDVDESKMAFIVAGNKVKVLAPKPALVRNRIIVDSVDIMIATPAQSHEVLRSGTWATIRYAKKVGRVIHVVYPNKLKGGTYGNSH